MKEIKEKIINFCNGLGIDTIGFIECREFKEIKDFFHIRKEKNFFNEFEEQDIEKKINPMLLMKDGKTIMSIAFPYNYETSPEGKSKFFSKYTLGLDYHNVIKKYLEEICHYIEELGGEAIGFVDNNPLPERYIAYLSGIGFIGKNNTLITEKYGSFVFLGEIIMNLEVPWDVPLNKSCYGCDLCIKHCPNHAIIEKDFLNSNSCISYITQKKEIDASDIDTIDGNVFGCDVCQDVCPHNKHTEISNIKEFHPKEYMSNANLLELINLDNKTFKEKYHNHSCGWRGKNIIIRNALINYKKIYSEDVDNIEGNIKSPYVREYYNKLFKKY